MGMRGQLYGRGGGGADRPCLGVVVACLLACQQTVEERAITPLNIGIALNAHGSAAGSRPSLPPEHNSAQLSADNGRNVTRLTLVDADDLVLVILAWGPCG
jgi:hypothetical protein